MKSRTQSMQVSADTVNSVPCFFTRDIGSTFLQSFASPSTIDILAMTPNILESEKDYLINAMKNGAHVKLLLTSASTAILWNKYQKSFLAKFGLIQDFIKKFGPDLCDLFSLRFITWSPAVGMILINSRSADGEAFVSIYTPNPESSSSEKLCLLFNNSENRPIFQSYAQQFRALWNQGNLLKLDENPHTLELMRKMFETQVRQSVWAMEGFRNKDLGFVIALEEEMEHFWEIMGPYKAEPDPKTGQVYYSFNLGNHKCIALLVGKMGKTNSAQSVERMLNHYSVGTVVSIGIAGSAKPNDVHEGDVTVASQVIDYLHRSKMNEGINKGDYEFLSGGAGFSTTHSLVSWIQQFRFTNPGPYGQWIADCNEDAKLILADLKYCSQAHSSALKCENPSSNEREVIVTRLSNTRIHADDIRVATLDLVISSRDFVKKLQETSDRNISVVEMESSGVVQAAAQHLSKPRTLVVRGISDLADKAKGDTEINLEGRNRSIAMRNASRLIRVLVEAGVLPLGSEEFPEWMNQMPSEEGG